MRSRSEWAIRWVGLSGVVVVSALLFLAFGVFGVRLLVSMPKPEAVATVPSAPAAAGRENPPPPAEGDPSDPKSVSPAQPVTAAPVPGGEGASAEVQKLLEVGKGVFTQCAACHGPGGKTVLPGMAPNLAGSSIANGPSERVVAVVLNGILPEGRFQGVMVPWKAMLTDEQIAGVLTYVRSSFGNRASPITPAMVAHARTKYAAQVNPMKRSDLEAINAELPK